MSTASSGNGRIRERTRRVTRVGVLAAAALLFSYLETLPPTALLPLPGFRVGLANVVVTLVLFEVSVGEAAAVAAIKVTVSALLFGSPVSLVLSAAGTVLSFLGLWLLRQLCPGGLSYVGLCIVGAALHNCGQVIAATALYGVGTLAYLPPLLVASTALGAVCGGVVCLMAPTLRRIGGRI